MIKMIKINNRINKAGILKLIQENQMMINREKAYDQNIQWSNYLK